MNAYWSLAACSLTDDERSCCSRENKRETRETRKVPLIAPDPTQ